MALTTIPVRTVKMKVIYEKSGIAAPFDDRGELSLQDDFISVADKICLPKSVKLTKGKKYKITLKIEEVE